MTTATTTRTDRYLDRLQPWLSIPHGDPGNLPAHYVAKGLRKGWIRVEDCPRLPRKITVDWLESTMRDWVEDRPDLCKAVQDDGRLTDKERAALMEFVETMGESLRLLGESMQVMSSSLADIAGPLAPSEASA